MIKLEDCLPTPLDQCPEALKHALEDPDDSMAFNPRYQKFKTEFSFLIRRLWTYSIVQEKSLMFVYSTDEDTKFIGIKVENEKEFVGEIHAPFPLSYLEIKDGIDVVAEKFNAVYCLTLTKHMSF